MEPVLIDSNVLIDIFSDDNEWFDWSRDKLTLLAQITRLYINSVIYSEISIGFEKIEILEECLSMLPIGFEEILKEALFLAGRAFLSYRRGGGIKTAPFPDFYFASEGSTCGTRRFDCSRFSAWSSGALEKPRSGRRGRTGY